MDFTALDFETYLIGVGAIAPKPVCLAETQVVAGALQPSRLYVGMDSMRNAFRAALQRGLTVFHNAAFDLTVAATHLDLLDEIFEALTRGEVHCTLLREKLYNLSTLGRIDGKRYSLAALAERYLRQDRRAWKGADAWRMRYSELDGVPLEHWPADAQIYPLQDTEDTAGIWLRQERIRKPRGAGSMNSIERQVKADFVLRLSTIEGIRVDPDQVARVSEEEMADFERLKHEIVALGYGSFTKRGAFKMAQKKVREYIEETYPDNVQRSVSEKGAITVKMGANDLKRLPYEEDPLVATLIEYAEVQKNCTTYYPQLKNAARVFPTYDVLKETTRTSSKMDKNYPSVNIQNQPRKGGVRECFIPDPGCEFIVADYCTIELASVANQLYEKFGHSRMRDDINAGIDIHSKIGARLWSYKTGRDISYDELRRRRKEGDDEADLFRTFGKPVDLGFPGGLGATTMVEFARATYGVEMTEKDAKEFRRIYLDEYPEIDEMFTWQTQTWGFIPKGSKRDRHNQHYEVQGVWRTGCTFCQHANGFMMQSPVAHGAKEALWDLTLAMYAKGSTSILKGSTLAWFVHDENGAQTRITPELRYAKAEALATIMNGAMNRVLPHVRIRTEVAVMDAWRKKGPFIAEYEFG